MKDGRCGVVCGRDTTMTTVILESLRFVNIGEYAEKKFVPPARSRVSVLRVNERARNALSLASTRRDIDV